MPNTPNGVDWQVLFRLLSRHSRTTVPSCFLLPQCQLQHRGSPACCSSPSTRTPQTEIPACNSHSMRVPMRLLSVGADLGAQYSPRPLFPREGTSSSLQTSLLHPAVLLAHCHQTRTSHHRCPMMMSWSWGWKLMMRMTASSLHQRVITPKPIPKNLRFLKECYPTGKSPHCTPSPVTSEAHPNWMGQTHPRHWART